MLDLHIEMDDGERGEELRRLRKAAGLAQWHVAREFGISDSAVSQWEKGDSKPDYRKLIRLDEMYHCDGEILALFDLGISWRDEANRLQKQVDDLRQDLTILAERLSAAGIPTTQSPPPRRGRRGDTD